MSPPKHKPLRRALGWAVCLGVAAVFGVGYWGVAVMMPVGVVDSLWGPRSPEEVADGDWNCGDWHEYLAQPQDRWGPVVDPQERRCRFTRLLHDYELTQVRFRDARGQTIIWHQDFRSELNSVRAWGVGIALVVLWVVLCGVCRPF